MKFNHPVYIYAAKRTAIGRFGGALKDTPAAKLAESVCAAVLLSKDASVEGIVAGQVLQAGVGMNVARQIALNLGLPLHVPAYTVNMVCGSGMKAAGLAAEQIANGESTATLAFGVESMSKAPYYSDTTRWGTKYGNSTLRDAIICDGLTDPTLHLAMGLTAEKLAAKYAISRSDQDTWATRSQQLAGESRSAFEREITPVEIKAGTFKIDEHARPDTTVEKLATLKPAFDSAGTVTAGNSSGINDGAAALLLGGESLRSQLSARAKILGYTTVGCDPSIMGIGPVAAIQKLCKEIGWNLNEVPAVEINEAFAAQTLACIRELGLSHEKVNQRGGAIALGHPIGCSGARVIVTLLHLMEDKGYPRGIASLCVGGGMGIAMALEIS